MMRKKILTYDELVRFFHANKIYSFDARETGYQLCVQSPAELRCFDKDDSESSLMYANVVVFHTGLNRNKSSVTVAAAKKAMRDFAYKPILAGFYTDENTGEMDFTTHDFEIGKDGKLVYNEHQVGCFTADEPYIEKDSANEDRQYVYAKCAIPKEYTETVNIIKRKNGTKCSAELLVNSISYDSKEKVLLLDDVELAGLTLLGRDPDTGEEVKEGMEGARVDLIDFSVERNSVISGHSDVLEIMREIKDTLDNFVTAKAESMKGGEKGMKDFENEAVVSENKDADEVEKPEEDVAPVNDDEFEAANEDSSEDVASNGDMATLSMTVGGMTKTFGISLVTKLNALTELVNTTYGESDNDFYACDADEDCKEVYAHGMFGNKHFKQKYSVKKDVFSLQGDRVNVFAKYLTEDEIKELDQMKANYAEISERLAKYEAEPEKMGILNSDEYVSISDTDEFKAFKAQDAHFDMSVEDVRKKVDGMLLDAAKSGKLNFSEKKDIGMMKLPVGMSAKSSRYGGLGKSRRDE